MPRSSYPLITPPRGDVATIDWVMENPAIAGAMQHEPDRLGQFLGSFVTSALLGSIGELFERTGLVGLDLSVLSGASGGQLAQWLTIANGWDPARTFAHSRLYTAENQRTPQGRTVPNFSQALAELLHHQVGPEVRVYREVMFHGTQAHANWMARGADPAFASGFDIVVVVGSAQQLLAIEIDEPCDIHNRTSFHATPDQKRKDDQKDADAARLGIPVLRLSENQVWRHTPACLGLALRLLDLYTPLDVQPQIYHRLDYRALPRQARFTEVNVRDRRAPRGWRAATAIA